jgi:signal peptidase I
MRLPKLRKFFPWLLPAIIAGLLIVAYHPGCRIEHKTWTVAGGSLEGIVSPEQEVVAEEGYYTCNEPQRGEVVIYQMPGRKEPLIKQIRAIPGDAFGLEKTKAGNHILINGSVLTTTKGEPYLLTENRFKYLSMYVAKYHALVPPGQVLILGNIATGSLDSTQFGFVPISNLIGRVQL